MQQIIFEKPYEFIPPIRSDWIPDLIQWFNLYGIYLKKKEGVVTHELRHPERLKASLDEGCGILLAPNHCRTSDPLVIGFLARQVQCHVYTMASWHLFNQSRFNTWAIRAMGGFSIFREGMDRKAINTAIEAMVEAKRPLIIYPEGATSRTNDRLRPLLDGVALVARGAARRREKQQLGRTVIHPIALKYRFQGDLEAAIAPVLTQIEQRFSWPPQTGRDLIERIHRVGNAMLTLKELQYFGKTLGSCDLAERTEALVQQILGPLEEEYLPGKGNGDNHVVARVKNLRTKMIPEMISGTLPAEERARRWVQLEDIYTAQQISCHLPDYLESFPSVDRLLETVERYEEDLTDKTQVHGHQHVIIEVGEAIEVSSARSKSDGEDPLMRKLTDQLSGMLEQLARESPLYHPGPNKTFESPLAAG
ncbi:MAG: 1-acyl-sn-glycerol-3-phosphate acyltransferase [Pirellulaceae bacterium]